MNWMPVTPLRPYVIEASPKQLRDSGRWTLEVPLWRDSGDAVTVCPFYGSDTFETRDEAVQHCFNYGRQIIDGKVPNCTAP